MKAKQPLRNAKLAAGISKSLSIIIGYTMCLILPICYNALEILCD